jgi:hypothetical protein
MTRTIPPDTIPDEPCSYDHSEATSFMVTCLMVVTLFLAALIAIAFVQKHKLYTTPQTIRE